jgi:hypothetical protein
LSAAVALVVALLPQIGLVAAVALEVIYTLKVFIYLPAA